jgi:hypothetical protein
MAGLVPAIHVFELVFASKARMLGTRPGMTGLEPALTVMIDLHRRRG